MPLVAHCPDRRRVVRCVRGVGRRARSCHAPSSPWWALGTWSALTAMAHQGAGGWLRVIGRSLERQGADHSRGHRRQPRWRSRGPMRRRRRGAAPSPGWHWAVSAARRGGIRPLRGAPSWMWRRPVVVRGLDGAYGPTRPASARERHAGPRPARARRASWHGQGRAAKGVRFSLLDDERRVHLLRWHQGPTEAHLGEALQ